MNVYRAAAVVAVLIMVGGCGSDSHPLKAPPAQPAAYATPHAEATQAPTMAGFRTNLLQAQKDIDTTLASLKDLTSPQQQDLQSAYNTYCDQLAQMQQHSESMKREADTMRASADTYFGNWEENVAQIDNPTIRASADARRKRLRDAHDQIITTSTDAKDAYMPFTKDLQEIKKYLSSGLSKSKVADLGDAAKKVQGDGAMVKARIDAIIQVLDSVEAGKTT